AVVGGRGAAGDDGGYVRLGRPRNVAANVAERGAGGAGEVVAVSGRTRDDGLGGAQDSNVVAGHAGARWGIDDMGSKLPVDGSTELIHVKLPQIYWFWSTPAPEDADGPQDLPALINTRTRTKNRDKDGAGDFLATS